MFFICFAALNNSTLDIVHNLMHNAWNEHSVDEWTMHVQVLATCLGRLSHKSGPNHAEPNLAGPAVQNGQAHFSLVLWLFTLLKETALAHKNVPCQHLTGVRSSPIILVHHPSLLLQSNCSCLRLCGMSSIASHIAVSFCRTFVPSWWPLKLFMSVAEIYEVTLMAEQQWPLCPLALSGGFFRLF